MTHLLQGDVDNVSASAKYSGSPASNAGSITPREAEVLRGIVQHQTNTDIAESLVISVRTVESHVSNLLAKFDVPNRSRLVAAVRELEDDAPPKIEPAPSLLRMSTAGSFVGRSDELQTLHGLWQTMPHQALVTITGDSGIGKSRLVSEFARQLLVTGDPVVLHGRCNEDGSGPFEAIGYAIAPLVHARRGKRLATGAEDMTDELAAILPTSTAPIHQPLEKASSGDLRIRRLRLFDAVSRILQRATDSGPLLLVFDDIQWAPKPTLLFIKHLIQERALQNTLIACTFRVDHESDDLVEFLGDMRRDAMPTHIQLNGLRRIEIAELLGADDGTYGIRNEAFSDTLAHDILAETNGNPLYAGEVIRNLTVDGRPRIAGQGRITHGVKDIVAARVHRLESETQNLVASAAVLGQALEVPVLRRVSQLGEDEFVEALSEASRAQIIYDVTSVPVDAYERYEFVHQIVRESIIDTMPQAEVRHLHAAAAEAIEQLFPDELEQRADEVAAHLVRAGRITDQQNLSRYLTMAGRAALNSSAGEEGLHLLEQALEFSDVATLADRAELWYQRGLALRMVGRWQDSMESLRSALALYADLGDLSAVARTCRVAGYHMFWFFRVHEAHEFALYGLNFLGARQDADRATLLGISGFAHAWSGEYRSSMDSIAEELSIASRLDDPQIEAHGLAMRSMSLAAYMEHRDAATAGYQALDLLRNSDDTWTRVSVLGFLKYVLVGLGRIDDARDIGDELDRVAVGVGHYAAQQQHARMHAMVEFFEHGSTPAFERFARKDLAFSDALGLGPRERSLAWLGLAHFLAGRWDEAKTAYERALEIESKTVMVGWVWSELFELLCYRGDRDAAMTLLAKNRRTLPRMDEPNTCGSWVAGVAIVEGLVVLGEFDLAFGLLPSIEQCIQRTGVVCLEFRDGRLVARAAAIAAAAGGDWDRATRYFELALEQADAIPHVVERAHTLRSYGEMLLKTGKASSERAAVSRLQDARASYIEFGMPRHATLCDEAISLVSSHTSRRQPPNTSG